MYICQVYILLEIYILFKQGKNATEVAKKFTIFIIKERVTTDRQSI